MLALVILEALDLKMLTVFKVSSPAQVPWFHSFHLSPDFLSPLYCPLSK